MERSRAHPRLCCDHCRLPIADAITACHAWRVGDESAEVVTLHDDCLEAFTEAQGGAWQGESLEILPLLLEEGAGIDHAKELRVARVWAGFGAADERGRGSKIHKSGLRSQGRRCLLNAS